MQGLTSGLCMKTGVLQVLFMMIAALVCPVFRVIGHLPLRLLKETAEASVHRLQMGVEPFRLMLKAGNNLLL